MPTRRSWSDVATILSRPIAAFGGIALVFAAACSASDDSSSSQSGSAGSSGTAGSYSYGHGDGSGPWSGSPGGHGAWNGGDGAGIGPKGGSTGDGTGIWGKGGGDGAGMWGKGGGDGAGMWGKGGGDGTGMWGKGGSGDGTGMWGKGGQGSGGSSGDGSGFSVGQGGGGDGAGIIVGQGGAGNAGIGGSPAGSPGAGGTGVHDCIPTPERCNGLDDDCDGVIDPPGSALCKTHYRDDDGDGFGVESDSSCVCEPTAPYLTVAIGDCDDTNPAVSPSATETCNGLDDDCNGQRDDGPGTCACPVENRGGHAYQRCPYAKSWAEAEAACALNGYHLASIVDQGEQSFVAQAALSATWIGLSDVATPGSFVWSDGQPASYTNWQSGPPAAGSGHDCAVIGASPPADAWTAESCDELLGYVCKAN